MEEKRSYLAVIAVQAIYSGMFLLSKAAFDVGQNTFIFVFYRQAVAAVFLVPIAFLLEWKTAPALSWMIMFKIFMLSLFGITFSLNIYSVALEYTSATLAAATTNTLPVITFFFALLLGLEHVDFKTMAGVGKVVGIALCIGGAATIAIFRGPYLRLLLHSHLLHNHIQEKANYIPPSRTWTKGVLFMLLSNISWSMWLVFQGQVLRHYPSKLLSTALQCLLSAFQSFVLAIALERDPTKWKLGWNISLLSIGYCGAVVTGVAFYLQAWVVEKKGPVFLAMTTPLSLILTIFASAILFGEIISLGSVLGGILLILGLYFVLRGKTMEKQEAKKNNALTSEMVFEDEIAKEESNPHKDINRLSYPCV